MRIGLLASTGGMLDTFFPEIVDAWREAGHTVLTAAGTPSERIPGSLIGGLTRRPALSAPRAQRELRAWCTEKRCDVVVTNSATASALVRMSGLQVPVVYFCHGLHWNGVTTVPDRIWQMVEHQLLERTDAVLTINSDDEAWFRQRLPSHTVERIRAGVGLDLRHYPRTPLPEGPLRLAWIGEHSARKRPRLALDAAVELRRRGVRFHLTMTGTGAGLERTRRDVSARGLVDCVTVEGWGDAARALSGAHALIHTAQWEGLPRVMLEAFAVGRRTYAFDVKGVRDAPGAVLVRDADPAALADAIRRDWESGQLRQPLEEDPRFLCSEDVARRILGFLRGTVVPPGGGSGGVVSAQWDVEEEVLDVLAVCTGNICRSPLVERILQRGFDELEPGAVRVRSVGTQALDGDRTTLEIRKLATRMGVDIADFRARPMTAEDIRRADLVLALDRGHRAAVVEAVPQALGRTFTLREFARLLPQVAAEHRASLPQRWRSAVALAGRQRRRVVGDPSADDVVDPYRRDESVHREMAGQLVPAADALLQWERRAAVCGNRRAEGREEECPES